MSNYSKEDIVKIGWRAPASIFLMFVAFLLFASIVFVPSDYKPLVLLGGACLITGISQFLRFKDDVERIFPAKDFEASLNAFRDEVEKAKG